MDIPFFWSWSSFPVSQSTTFISASFWRDFGLEFFFRACSGSNDPWGSWACCYSSVSSFLISSNFLDLSGVPACYLDLKEVFSKARATSFFFASPLFIQLLHRSASRFVSSMRWSLLAVRPKEEGYTVGMSRFSKFSIRLHLWFKGHSLIQFSIFTLIFFLKHKLLCHF